MKIRNIFQSCKLNEARQRFAATKFSDSDVKDQTKLNRRIDNEKDEVAQSLEDSKEHSEQVVNVSKAIESQGTDAISPKEQIEQNLDSIKVNSQNVLNLGINSSVVDSLMEIGIDVYRNGWTNSEKTRGVKEGKGGSVVTVQSLEKSLDDVSRDVIRLFNGKAYMIPHLSAFIRDKRKGHFISIEDFKKFTKRGGGSVFKLIEESDNLTANQKTHLKKIYEDLFGITPQGTGPGELILTIMMNKGRLAHDGYGDIKVMDDTNSKLLSIEVKGGNSTISGFDLSVKNATQAYSRLANYIIHHCERALIDKNYGGHYDRIEKLLDGYGCNVHDWHFSGKPTTSVQLPNLHHNNKLENAGGGYEEFFGVSGGKPKIADYIIMFAKGNDIKVKKEEIDVKIFDAETIKDATRTNDQYFRVDFPVCAARGKGTFPIFFAKRANKFMTITDYIGWSKTASYQEAGNPWSEPVGNVPIKGQLKKLKTEEEIRGWYKDLIRKSFPDNMQSKAESLINKYE